MIPKAKRLAAAEPSMLLGPNKRVKQELEQPGEHQQQGAGSGPKSSHVVFCIDQSRSMALHDVKTSG